MTSPNYSQVAYEAYLAQAGGRSLVSGATLPCWEDLDQGIRDAWRAAASAVIDAAYLHAETKPEG